MHFVARLSKIGLLLTALYTPLSYGLGMGVQAGAGFTSLSSDNAAYSSSTTTDLLFGGYVNLGLLPFISLQPELLFRGASDAGDWIGVPVLARLKIGVGDTMSILGLVGPQASFRLSNRSLKSVDFNLVAGAGLSFEAFPLVDIFFQGRYLFGLNDINNDSSAVPGSLHSRQIQLLAGVAFEL